MVEPLRDMIDEDTNSDSFESWVGERIILTDQEISHFTGDLQRRLIDSNREDDQFSASNEALRTIEEILIETSTFSGILFSPDFINNPYVPLPNPPVFDPPAPLPHGFTDRGKLVPQTFSFFYPPAESVPIFVIGPPEFGDSDSYRNIKEQKYSRGNTLILFHVWTWGTENIYEYGFNNLATHDRRTLLEFLRWTLGHRIKIKDHFDIVRYGFILTPENEVAQPSRKDFAFSFRFQEG